MKICKEGTFPLYVSAVLLYIAKARCNAAGFATSYL